MNEEFLKYIWKFKLFNTVNMLTSDKTPIQIIQQGIENQDSGPDFFNAKIKIGKELWVGNVELHINASDWYKHNHQNDTAYNNVILHVVFNNDEKVFTQNKVELPTLELKNYLIEEVFEKYKNFQKATTWVACQSQIKQVDDFVINSWMERLTIERLERKSNELNELLLSNNNDWEETFYQALAKYFGGTANQLPFLLLSKQLPLKYINKSADNELQIQAMFFGVAGLLNTTDKDEYFNGLKKEYQFLKSKYQLNELNYDMWKFLRMRPSNFPTLRISQFANIFKQHHRLFQKILNFKSTEELIQLFEIPASDYWKQHYVFGKTTNRSFQKKPGKSFVNTLIINVVVPVMFLYANLNKQNIYKEKALNLLRKLPAETNNVTKKWEMFYKAPQNAFESQAFLELKNNFCNQKKCLNCRIGNYILTYKMKQTTEII